MVEDFGSRIWYDSSPSLRY